MDEDMLIDVLEYADSVETVEYDLDFGPDVRLDIPLEDL